MGFKVAYLGDTLVNKIEFGHGDIHMGFLTDEPNIFCLYEGQKGEVGRLVSTDDIDIDKKALKENKVLLMKFNSSHSVDVVLSKLKQIKQNLIENGK